MFKYGTLVQQCLLARSAAPALIVGTKIFVEFASAIGARLNRKMFENNGMPQYKHSPGIVSLSYVKNKSV